MSTLTHAHVEPEPIRSSPRAIQRPHHPRTAFTKSKVFLLLGVTVCAMIFASWHGQKRPAVQTMSTVTVEGTAVTMGAATSDTRNHASQGAGTESPAASASCAPESIPAVR